jgi:hypothetical protein
MVLSGGFSLLAYIQDTGDKYLLIRSMFFLPLQVGFFK